MNSSVLDLFILSALDRGCVTPYDLQRVAGISLGGSLPALRRLLKSKMVAKSQSKTGTNRPRHHYRLTTSGKVAAETAWWPYINQEFDLPGDLDSVLRLTDMAVHYGADKRKISSFLKLAAKQRRALAAQAELKISQAGKRDPQQLSYSAMRLRCDASRLRAEAETLVAIAESIVESKESPGRVQQMISYPPSDLS